MTTKVLADGRIYGTVAFSTATTTISSSFIKTTSLVFASQISGAGASDYAIHAPSAGSVVIGTRVTQANTMNYAIMN